MSFFQILLAFGVRFSLNWMTGTVFVRRSFVSYCTVPTHLTSIPLGTLIIWSFCKFPFGETSSDVFPT